MVRRKRQKVLQQRVFRLAVVLLGLLMLPAMLWAAPANAEKATGSQAGCRDGWRRVGTRRDATLDRTWAVVASCRHPAWPARLEPASRWTALPKWVPAGSRVAVTSEGAVTAMRLKGRTVSPGRVGQTVTVRLTGGLRVRAKLTAADRAEMAPVLRWRQP